MSSLLVGSFRAGRATSMAAAGDPLGKILEFGDWRSKAVLSYIDESHVDASRVLLDSIEASGDEDEVDAQAEDVGSLP